MKQQNGITPRPPNQKGLSLADAFDIKPKELNDCKQQMTHSQPPPPIQTKPTTHSKDQSRPTSPHNKKTKNDSMS